MAFDYPDYHAVGDEWQKIDYDNMAKVDRAIALAMFLMADSEQPVRWNEANPKTAPFVKAWKQLETALRGICFSIGSTRGFPARDGDADAALGAGTSGIGYFNSGRRQSEKWRFALRGLGRAEQDHATNRRWIVAVQRAPARGHARAICQRLPDEERLPTARHPEQQSP